MFVIVGLGNPGLSYAKTRHNAGFQALDALAKKLDVRVRTKGFSALYGEGHIGSERVVLVKPQTYMNLSGEAVQQILHFYKLEPERLIVQTAPRARTTACARSSPASIRRTLRASVSASARMNR